MSSRCGYCRGSLGAAGVQFNACSATDCAYPGRWANWLPRRRRMAGGLVAGQGSCPEADGGALARAAIPIARPYPARRASTAWLERSFISLDFARLPWLMCSPLACPCWAGTHGVQQRRRWLGFAGAQRPAGARGGMTMSKIASDTDWRTTCVAGGRGLGRCE